MSVVKSHHRGNGREGDLPRGEGEDSPYRANGREVNSSRRAKGREVNQDLHKNNTVIPRSGL